MPAPATTPEDELEIEELEYESTTPVECAPEIHQSLGTEAICQSSDVKAMSADFTILTRQKGGNLHGNNHWIMPNKYGQGMRTEIHESAPIVLFQHGYPLPYPIGISETPDGKYTVRKTASKATATVYFSQILPEAELIFGLVNEGILRMSSIGFKGLKAMVMQERKRGELPEGVEDLENRYRGLDFVETQLMEWSIVDRGADQGAMRQLLDRGSLNGVKLTQALRPEIERLAGPKKVQVPGMTLHRQSIESLGVTIEGDKTAVELACQRLEEAAKPLEKPVAPQEPLDVQKQSGTTVEQSIDPGLLAELYRADDQHRQFQRELQSLFAQEIGKAFEPLLSDVRQLAESVNQRTGKLP